jgi:F420H(2)-dependent quinone reductase
MAGDAEMLSLGVTDQVKLSPTDWVREQTEQILEQGTTDGIVILDRPVVLFTVTGAKSGHKRYVPLMRVEKDGRYAMIGSIGGSPKNPSWVYNLRANPQVTVQDGDKVLELTAREVHGAERDDWWQRGTEAYPHYVELQSLTTRKIPVFVVE